DAHRWVRPKDRDDLFPQAAHELHLTEHPRDADPDDPEEPVHARLAAKDSFLVGGDGRDPFTRHRVMKASLEGFACVLAKVIPVAETYALAQKPELDLLWTGLPAL